MHASRIGPRLWWGADLAGTPRRPDDNHGEKRDKQEGTDRCHGGGEQQLVARPRIASSAGVIIGSKEGREDGEAEERHTEPHTERWLLPDEGQKRDRGWEVSCAQENSQHRAAD